MAVIFQKTMDSNNVVFFALLNIINIIVFFMWIRLFEKSTTKKLDSLENKLETCIGKPATAQTTSQSLQQMRLTSFQLGDRLVELEKKLEKAVLGASSLLSDIDYVKSERSNISLLMSQVKESAHSFGTILKGIKEHLHQPILLSKIHESHQALKDCSNVLTAHTSQLTSTCETVEREIDRYKKETEKFQNLERTMGMETKKFEANIKELENSYSVETVKKFVQHVLLKEVKENLQQTNTSPELKNNLDSILKKLQESESKILAAISESKQKISPETQKKDPIAEIKKLLKRKGQGEEEEEEEEERKK